MAARKSDPETAAPLPGAMASEPEFVITRVLAAPRELVFRAWTEPEMMARWWGPHEFTNPVCRLDVRPGGAWYIVMRGSDGVEHPCKGVFREVVPPERIVMTIDHSDLPEDWHDMLDPGRPHGQARPALLGVATVTFVEQAGQTTLTIRVRYESSELRDSFLRMGMNEGWSQSLERLASLVQGAAV